jgi:hypothetical protein
LPEKQVLGLFYGEGPDWGNAGWREMAVSVGSHLNLVIQAR